MGRLTGIETVLLDLDGTLYVGSQVVPGAPEAVRWLRDQGLTVRFCTNTDSITPAALADRLARFGFQASEEELVTPVAVAERLFGAAPEARVLAVAADGVRQLLAGSWPGRAPPTHVLVADPSYGATYEDLDAAFRALRAGAELVATQVNRIARPRRRRAPGHRRVGAAAGVRHRLLARVLGKPSPEFFTAPLDALGRGARNRAGRRRRPGRRHRRWTGGRRGHGAGPQRQGGPPQPAPGPSPTRSSTASPTCRTCSEGERADRSPEDVDWCGGPAPSARLGRSTWNSATREAQRGLSSPSRRRCGVQVVALHVGAQQQPEGHEVDQQL